MASHSMNPALRITRACMHLMIGAFLALAAVKALAPDAPHAPATLAASAVFALAYLSGAALAQARTSEKSARIWLAAVTTSWLLLVALTPDAVGLAFPLFFLELHLLPRRWALPAVAATTAVTIITWCLHAGTIVAGAVVGPTLGAAVAVVGVVGYEALYRESEQRRRLIDELTQARTGLATAERTAGVLAERERLAREIHDTLAQGLSSIHLLLRAAERTIPDRPDTALDHVRQARETAVENLAEARRFVRALSPPDLENGSLPAALRRLCETTASTSGIAVRCHISGTPTELPTQHEVALLRIAQSALANTIQHAHAEHAELTLSYMETEVALDIVDDGTGFTATRANPEPADRAPDRGFGIAAMRARAAELHGTLVIEAAPGEGTALAVTLPIPNTAAFPAPRADTHQPATVPVVVPGKTTSPRPTATEAATR